jgi:hypothetical protein
MLNDYGMAPGTTFFLALENGVIPKNIDVYDPNGATTGFGNTNFYENINGVITQRTT